MHGFLRMNIRHGAFYLYQKNKKNVHQLTFRCYRHLEAAQAARRSALLHLFLQVFWYGKLQAGLGMVSRE